MNLKGGLVLVCVAMLGLGAVFVSTARADLCQGPADCDDGNECTQNRCVNGTCVFPNRPPGTACASDDDPCTRDLCQANSGAPSSCQHLGLPIGTVCADEGNECTRDYCAIGPLGAPTCQHFDVPGGSACKDDGNDCTVDYCLSGPVGMACQHLGVSQGTPCKDDGNDCTMDMCAQSGNGMQCQHNNRSTGSLCSDDKNDCTFDMCEIGPNGIGICKHNPLQIGAGCDDGSICTQIDSCDSSGHCVGTSFPGDCRGAEKSRLKIVNNDRNSKDLVDFKWIKGEATDTSEFGDPTLETDYTLCVFDSTGLLKMSAHVAPGQDCGDDACWQENTKGYVYRDPLRLSNGIGKVILKSGLAGKSSVAVSGKGNFLPVPILPLQQPVTVQVVNDETGVCFESEFNGAKTNTDKLYKASNP